MKLHYHETLQKSTCTAGGEGIGRKGQGSGVGGKGSRRGHQSGGKMVKDEFRGATLKGLVDACLRGKGAVQRVERATCFV